ncbi:MspA family porin [Gordonia shandongensis]|uniref:MspA family porin n=1 Tax=Gordonia shandongensis TaxID=376351 RepID=UPI0003F9C1CC|nr:MspA family porin [Gordonia shandongensis]
MTGTVATAATADARVTPQNPSGYVREVVKTLKTPEGLKAKVGFSRGKAKIQPSRAITPFSNRFTVSGSGWGQVTDFGKSSSQAANVETGYIVACQVGVDSATAGAGAQLGAIALAAFGGALPAGAAGPFATVSGNVSVTVSPGTAKRITFGNKSIDAPRLMETFGVRYNSVEVSVDKCGGNIDAVAYTTLSTSNRQFDASKTIYGQLVRVR